MSDHLVMFEWRQVGDEDWIDLEHEDILGDGYFAAAKIADLIDEDDRAAIRCGRSIEFEMWRPDGSISLWSAWGEAIPTYYPHKVRDLEKAEETADV